MTDVIIIGGGPAGVSAALTAMHRGKTALIVSSPPEDSPLWKAEHIDNYPGLPGVTGRELLQKLLLHAEGSGAKLMRGRVLSIMPMGTSFGVSVGSDFVQGRSVVIASGLPRAKPYPGETQFLGAGVSYCATCDGMLYRGRKAVVTGDAADLAEEVAFLNRIGVQVTVATRKPAAGLPEGVEAITARTLAVEGQDRLEGLSADGRLIPCDVVFILREVMAPDSLAPGLELDGRFVRVNREQETNIPGLYAAGDCTGRPLQVAKAVGEGLVAGQNAARSLGQGE